MKRLTASLALALPMACFLFLTGCDPSGEEFLEPGELVVDAGATQVVDELTTVTLSGSARSGSGEIVAWRWEQLIGTPIELTGNQAATAAFTAPEAPLGQSLLFRLTATDSEGISGSNEVEIVVERAFNRPPVANAGFDQDVDPLEFVHLGAIASYDIDGEIVEYGWRQIEGHTVELSDASSPAVEFEAPVVTPDEPLVFELTVTDNDGATTTDTVEVTVRELTRSPGAPTLVTVSSMSTDSAVLNWLPASRETEGDQVVYTIHLSTEPHFIPTGATAYMQTSGVLSETVTNLRPETQYYARVAAHTPGSRYGWSNELGFATATVALEMQPDAEFRVLDHSDGLALEQDSISWDLQAGDTLPETGEVLIGGDPEMPFIRKVVSVTRDGDRATAITEAASMTELFSELSISSSARFIDASVEKRRGDSGALNRLTPPKGQEEFGLHWPDSGLIFIQDDIESFASFKSETNHQSVPTSTSAMLRLHGVRHASAEPGDRVNVSVTTSVSNPSIQIQSFELKRVEAPRGRLITEGNRQGQYQTSQVNNRLDFSWVPQIRQADPNGNPYELVFEATAEDTDCRWYSLRWCSSTVEMRVKVFIAFDQQIPDRMQFDASRGGIDFHGSVGLKFEPDFSVHTEVTRGRLRKAEFIATARPQINLQALVETQGSASAEHTQQLFQKRFVKILPAGPVPVIVVGTFTLDARFSAEALGSLNVDQEFEKALEIEAGMDYLRGRSPAWQPVSSAKPSLSYTIKGEADAEVEVEVRLIPEMKISVYEILAGYVTLEPYLFGEVALDGVIQYDYNPAYSAFDAAYRFTKLDVGGGVDLGLRADVSVLDYTIAGWPSRDPNDYHHVTVLGKRVFYGLPTLSVAREDDHIFAIGIRDTTVMKRNPFVRDSGLWRVHPSEGNNFQVRVEEGAWDGTRNDARQTALVCIDASEAEYEANLRELEFTVRFAGHARLGSWLAMFEQLGPDRLPRCDDDACLPDCAGKECGDDGCGGECSPGCAPGTACTEEGICMDAMCSGDCGEMVSVPAGSFWMGCNEDVDEECYAREYPYRQVSTPAFEIDKNHVTQALYRRCVSDGVCTVPGDGQRCNWYVAENREDHPINCITWQQGRQFCAWAGKRLCTEAEWEKAARGTDGRKFPWGNEEASCEYAVFSDGAWGCGTNATWPVGSIPAGASPYGALDMAGNVFDWVEDDYLSSYLNAPTDGSAYIGDPRGSYRVYRGGSFAHPVRRIRASNRMFDGPTHTSMDFGVRCCL